jgi:hypothetical protein
MRFPQKRASMPLQELPGWLRDIKELENQGLIYIDDMKMIASKRANLTRKAKATWFTRKLKAGKRRKKRRRARACLL